MVKVRFFAVLKHLVGKEELSLEVEEETTLAQVIEKLQENLPALKDLLSERRILISVNQEAAEKSCLIKNGDEIAFLPPFAGGASSSKITKCHLSEQQNLSIGGSRPR
ncbi:MAG: MoaD/ThiS family protein [Nitrospiria bacterium]